MKKFPKKQFGGSTYVAKPQNTLAVSPNYAGRQNVDLSSSPNIRKVKEDEENRRQLALRKKQGYTTGTGEATPIYPETLLFPGTPAIRGIGKLGNIAVDAANPLSGLSPKANILHDIDYAVENLINSVSRRFKPKAEEGVEWMKKWYSHPETLRRIDVHGKELYDYNKIVANGANPNMSLNVLRDPVTVPAKVKDYKQLKIDKPDSFKQRRLTTGGISYGVPEGMYINKGMYNDNNRLQSTVVHEATHVLESNGGAFNAYEEAGLTSPFKIKKRLKDVDDFDEQAYDYLTDPTEVHARMNQARYDLKLKPDEQFTENHYDEMIKRNNFHNLGKYIDGDVGKETLIDLMNNFYTPTAVIGAGVIANENMKKQYGGAGSKVLVEKDEFYRDETGQLRRATNAPSHDDEVMVDDYGAYKVDEGDGGEVVDATSVISASYDQVGRGRKGGKKEQKFAFKPSRQRELMEENGIDWYKPSKKPLSPSSFVERAGVQASKIIKKYKIDPEITGSNPYTKATQAANDALIENMPTLDDFYDIAFEEQEVRRNGKSRKAQYGGSTYVQKPLKDRPLTEEEIYALKRDKLGEIYTNERFPEASINYHTDSDALMKHPNGLARAYNFNNNLYIKRGSERDLQAELSHTKQFQKVSDVSSLLRSAKDFIGSAGVYDNMYDVEGTIENEAHEIIQPQIKRDYDEYVDNLRQSPYNRSIELPKKLGGIKRKQYGGVPISLDGLYEYPNQPVIVPSGDITMDGIQYPVDAYDNETGEYLETMEPNQQYNFDVNEVLEIPRAQDGYTAHLDSLIKQLERTKDPARRAQIQKTIDQISTYVPERDARPYDPLAVKRSRYPVRLNSSPIPNDVVETPYTQIIGGEEKLLTNSKGQFVDQKGKVWKKNNNSFVPTKQVAAQPRFPTTYAEYTENPTDQYTVRKGDWVSSIAPMFGMEADELIALNPQLSDPNKISVGSKLNIRRRALAEPVDRMSEIEGLQELPEELNVQAEDVIPTLDVQSENVPANGIGGKLKEAAKAIGDVSLGRINRDIPVNALRAMMSANRSVELPYRPEVARRTYNYNEIDVSPQLNRIAAGTNQQLQNINQNTTVGQAVANSLGARKLAMENEAVARTSQQNRQIRTQVDNANVQALNQYDNMQEQANANYVDGVQQVLTAQDRAKVQQADYLDQLIRERNSTDNAITMMNVANPNFKINPRTGEVVRVQTKFGNRPKARFGLKKKMC